MLTDDAAALADGTGRALALVEGDALASVIVGSATLDGITPAAPREPACSAAPEADGEGDSSESFSNCLHAKSARTPQRAGR